MNATEYASLEKSVNIRVALNKRKKRIALKSASPKDLNREATTHRRVDQIDGLTPFPPGVGRLEYRRRKTLQSM